MTKHLILAITLISACAVDADNDDEDTTSETEQNVYSSWHYLSISHAPYSSMQVRVCKTSTRVYWQFQNNSFWDVNTAGDSIANLTTYIKDVPSGSKWRTRPSSTFWINPFSAAYSDFIVFDVASMPNC